MFTLRRLLIVVGVLVVALWFALQAEVNRRCQKILVHISEQTVEPVRIDHVSFNPFTQIIKIKGLELPQRRLVGVDESLLKKCPLIQCDEILLQADWVTLFKDNKLILPQVTCTRLQLGAVIGPEVNRIDLMYLPGLLTGLFPGPDGRLSERFAYELEKLEAPDLRVRLLPTHTSEKMIPVIIQGVLEGRQLSNRVLSNDQVGVMGQLKFSGQSGDRGKISGRLEIDSFYNLFKRANGRLILQAKHLPADYANLFLGSLGFRFGFTSGEMSLDLDMDIHKAQWVRRRDVLKLIQARVSTAGRLDILSRQMVEQLRRRGGNARFEYWLAGSLGHFRAGPYFFNPAKAF